jgi:hypothetical protein
MKNRKIIAVNIVLCTLFTFGTLTTPVFGATAVSGASHELYTITGLIDLLISKGIIGEAKAEYAHELARLIEQTEDTETTSSSSDNVEVSVSQYIEYGDLTYTTYEDIKGLLLTVKNTGDTAQTLEAKRNCQVVYRIYDDSEVLVYDSANEKKCQTKEQVTYMLEAGKTRVFPITHEREKYALRKGTYRFELEYPEYGKGERTIMVK